LAESFPGTSEPAAEGRVRQTEAIGGFLIGKSAQVAKDDGGPENAGYPG
jgi:hypothetical protein